LVKKDTKLAPSTAYDEGNKKLKNLSL